MNRAGKISREQILEVADVLAEAPFDGSRIQFRDAEVEEESPPLLTSEHEESSESGSLASRNSSGEPLRNGSEKSDEIPGDIGTTPSDTYSTSAVPIRSVS